MKKTAVILLTGFALFLAGCGGSRNTGLDKESEAYVLSVIEITNQQFSKHMEKQASVAEVPATASFSLERKKLVFKMKATRDLTDKEIQDIKTSFAMAAMWPQMILDTWRMIVNKEKEVVTDQFFEKLCEAKVEFFLAAEDPNGNIIAEVPIPLSAYKTPSILNNSDNPDGMKAPDTTSNLNEETEEEHIETVQRLPVKKETMRDPRDGRSYETVQIGSQIWLAENLHYMTDESYCYNDDPSYCDKYGRLYTWNAAKGACPEGWRLPNKEEIDSLFATVGGRDVAGEMLRKTTEEDDPYGFSALDAGFREPKGDYKKLDEAAFFWITDEANSNRDDNYLEVHLYAPNGVVYPSGSKLRGYSVRCVKGPDSTGKEFSTPNKIEEPSNESDKPQTMEATFTISGDKCKDKTEEAKALATKCRSIEKGTDEYKDCANSYKSVKDQIRDACRHEMDEKELNNAIKKWEKQVNKCQGKQNQRCASALQQLGHYQYQLEEKLAQENNKKADHQKSLGYFLEFIDKNPDHNKTPSVLFMTASIYETKGDQKKAYNFYMRIVKDFPTNDLAANAWMHIAELNFARKKFREAIEAYQKESTFKHLTSEDAATAMYHLAESYYNIKDYKMAASTIYRYINAIDVGEFPNNRRTEAINFMASAFSKMGKDGLKQAEDFFSDKNASFDKDVYQLIQEK